MSPRLAIASAVLSGILGAILAALWTVREPAPAPQPDTRREIDALRAELAAERDARRALEGEVAMLRLALDDSGPPEPAREPAAAEPVPLPKTPAKPAPPDSPRVAVWDDADAISAAGIDVAEARRLEERFEEHELAMLFLRDEARREGWLRRPRFRDEQAALRDALRGEVGEDDYDRMLWLAGRNNRVTVSNVIGRSAAEAAGLQSGDQIVSYGGVRIFELSRLTRATSEGRPGASTELRYRRGGEERRVYVPRGPLGVRLRSDHGPPDTLR